MKYIENKLFDEERALYGSADITVHSCVFDGPADGESAFKECQNIKAENLHFSNVTFKGKYSFQYIKNAVFENCSFDTKDTFWHAENITVRNTVIKGEYLAWYSNGLTLENCKIIGTQPFCYCCNLKLINCEMIDADLCFEKSEVDAQIITPVISIKNPHSGSITVPSVGIIIRDDAKSKGKIKITDKAENESA